MMSTVSWIFLLSIAAHLLFPAKSQNPYSRTSLAKRLIDGAMSPESSNWAYGPGENPGLLMNNYLAFLSRLAKKDIQDDQHAQSDGRSPKRDNRKFQTQGWR